MGRRRLQAHAETAAAVLPRSLASLLNNNTPTFVSRFPHPHTLLAARAALLVGVADARRMPRADAADAAADAGADVARRHITPRRLRQLNGRAGFDGMFGPTGMYGGGFGYGAFNGPVYSYMPVTASPGYYSMVSGRPRYVDPIYQDRSDPMRFPDSAWPKK